MAKRKPVLSLMDDKSRAIFRLTPMQFTFVNHAYDALRSENSRESI